MVESVHEPPAATGARQALLPDGSTMQIVPVAQADGP